MLLLYKKNIWPTVLQVEQKLLSSSWISGLISQKLTTFQHPGVTFPKRLRSVSYWWLNHTFHYPFFINGKHHPRLPLHRCCPGSPCSIKRWGCPAWKPHSVHSLQHLRANHLCNFISAAQVYRLKSCFPKVHICCIFLQTVKNQA